MSQFESPREARFEIDPIRLGRLLLKKRRWFVASVASVCVLTIIKLVLTPNVYTSSSVILPSGSSSDLNGIRELVGLGGSELGSSENSSALYPLILSSNLVRDSLLNKEYAITSDGEPLAVSMPEYFGQDDHNLLREALSDITEISASKRTGEIYLAVETEYPDLSRALVSEYLLQLENYNRFTRKSSARENQRYLELRVADADRNLAKAEDALEHFRAVNSNWAMTSNAEILREIGQLERDVSIRTASKILLEKQLELAKLDAQKDIPIVRVLDQPNLPTLKSGPRRTLTLLTVAILAAFLVAIGIIVADVISRSMRESERRSLASLRDELAGTFPRSIRALNLVRRERNHAPVEEETGA
jgi:uncharacterized protein involved in exopolysaccharide biosynthesis